ncbi:hypothetical protein DFH08DRAFT_816169 [Mycena albidolilacea]|uniref:Uncharacterized protein n=1 Tax=Mycena albidolilacea TaxID=1033008 RepID=A0AAD6ZLQ0_9AGAR|nr:hypothetical protein DFH08DRAFT_816169 [Mycena albidolilacea]
MENPSAIGVEEVEDDDNNKDFGSSPAPPSKKCKITTTSHAGARVPKGKDFWSQADTFFVKKIADFGSKNLQGSGWKDYVLYTNETLRIDESFFLTPVDDETPGNPVLSMSIGVRGNVGCGSRTSLLQLVPQGFKSSIQPPPLSELQGLEDLRTSRTYGSHGRQDFKTSSLQAASLQAVKNFKLASKTLLPFVGWFQGFKSLLRSSTQRQAPVFDSRLTTALSPSFTFTHVPGLSRPFMGVVHIEVGCRFYTSTVFNSDLNGWRQSCTVKVSPEKNCGLWVESLLLNLGTSRWPRG